MPLKYWDEAFLTAVFLINRLPSKVIADDTPYDRLLNNPPDYSFLRTFGCAVWPNLRPYNTKKLTFRSLRCVFIGYSNLHKGFKCLDPKTGRIYVSRDVVFDETVYPFSQLHPNAGARLRAELDLLPDVLKNPSHEFGTANVLDQCMVNSNPTNVVPSSSSAVDVTGLNSMQIGEGTMSNEPYFLTASSLGQNDTNGAEPSVAPSDPRTDLIEGSASGSEIDPVSLAWTTLALSSSAISGIPGSSTPSSTETPTSSSSPSAPSDLTGSNPRESSAGALVDSAVPDSSSPPADSSLPHLYGTRLQRGITKPKQYTDGTVRWLLHSSVEAAEPISIKAALSDQ